MGAKESDAQAWVLIGELQKGAGKNKEARAAYEKAIQLEPNNSYIKQNYELFKEINDRATRQNRR